MVMRSHQVKLCVCVRACLCDRTWAGVGGYDNDAMFLSWELTSCFGYEILLRASQACRNNRREFFFTNYSLYYTKGKKMNKEAAGFCCLRWSVYVTASLNCYTFRLTREPVENWKFVGLGLWWQENGKLHLTHELGATQIAEKNKQFITKVRTKLISKLMPQN